MHVKGTIFVQIQKKPKKFLENGLISRTWITNLDAVLKNQDKRIRKKTFSFKVVE